MVQSSPQMQRKPTTGNGMTPNESYPEHSAHWTNQHRDALRLALGSILAPKRPSASRSSSSGTASPAPPHTPPPVAEHLLHPHYVPSKLSLSTSVSIRRIHNRWNQNGCMYRNPQHEIFPPQPRFRTAAVAIFLQNTLLFHRLYLELRAIKVLNSMLRLLLLLPPPLYLRLLQ